jgi:hypothetical protein
VPRASGVPHALFGRKIQQRLGRIARRGREGVSGCPRLGVIASEAKQSILTFSVLYGLLRFARNDGLQTKLSWLFENRIGN